MPQYKLTYFNFKAVGESLRLIFVAAGVPFEDDKVPRDQWAEIKTTKKFGYGQVPVLYVDGRQMTQSLSIGRYLGNKFGLVPNDENLVAKCDEVVEFLTECRLEFRKIILAPEAGKDAAKAEFRANAAPKYYDIMSQLISETKGPFICGDKLSWADCFVANWVEIFDDFVVGKEFTDKYPVLTTLRDAVFAVPNIKKYLETRPKTLI